jgi:hypothetical protein
MKGCYIIMHLVNGHKKLLIMKLLNINLPLNSLNLIGTNITIQKVMVI